MKSKSDGVLPFQAQGGIFEASSREVGEGLQLSALGICWAYLRIPKKRSGS